MGIEFICRLPPAAHPGFKPPSFLDVVGIHREPVVRTRSNLMVWSPRILLAPVVQEVVFAEKPERPKQFHEERSIVAVVKRAQTERIHLSAEARTGEEGVFPSRVFGGG